ncbi:MAG: hypothetical protein ACQEXC_14325 [Pseudomonadota bacterium]
MTDKIRNKKRPSIYLSPPLEHVAEHLKDGESLSARLATIAERYAMICEEIPPLTDKQRHILGNTLSGSVVDSMLIKYLHDELEDSDAGTQEECRELAHKIRHLSHAQRIALIEKLGF